MVALNLCSISSTGFDDIGVEGSLYEELGVGDPTLGLFEDANEFFTDCFSFFFWVGDPFERFKECVSGAFVD